jgi:Domain of unknown function (DUF4329)
MKVIAMAVVVAGFLSAPVDGPRGYDTLEEAGVHASARAYQCSHAYECGGVIAQRPDGKYVVGPIQSTYSGDSLETSSSVPAGWKLVANYHSHPCNNESHFTTFFSPIDISNNLSHRITGFMVDLCSGDVHEFDPSKDSPNDTEMPDEGRFATKGRIVGHITVDGKSQEPDLGM